MNIKESCGRSRAAFILYARRSIKKHTKKTRLSGVTGEIKVHRNEKTHPFRLKKAHWNLVINISVRKRAGKRRERISISKEFDSFVRRDESYFKFN
jgi:hypothetical protein